MRVDVKVDVAGEVTDEKLIVSVEITDRAGIPPLGSRLLSKLINTSVCMALNDSDSWGQGKPRLYLLPRRPDA